MTTYLGKELFIRFTASAFRKLRSIYVFNYFPFGSEGRMWDLTVSVPDHCLSFYFKRHKVCLTPGFRLNIKQKGKQKSPGRTTSQNLIHTDIELGCFAKHQIDPLLVQLVAVINAC